MESVSQLVLFSLDEQRYALHLVAVERVVRAAAVTILPKAPEIILGVINFHGRIIPVLELRKRFGLPWHDLGLTDQLIVAHTSKRTVALVVDQVRCVLQHPREQVVPPTAVAPGLEQVEGLVPLQDGIVLIHDLDRTLSLDEEKGLDEALKWTTASEKTDSLN